MQRGLGATALSLSNRSARLSETNHEGSDRGEGTRQSKSFASVYETHDRLRLLAIGAELKHDVANVVGIVRPRTYSRWVVDRREGSKP